MPRVVRLYAFGGPENLRVEDAPSQQQGPGEVRLRVEAAGVNRDQFTFMQGEHYSGHGIVQPKLPTRLGYEVAGVVEAAGEGVDPAWLGRFSPNVAKAFPLEQTVEAYKYLATAQPVGRIIVAMG